MEIHTTATFDELFLKLPRKIQTKSDEKTKLFRENPYGADSLIKGFIICRVKKDFSIGKGIKAVNGIQFDLMS